MDGEEYELVTLAERPEMEEQVRLLGWQAWPEFLLHANIRHWRSLFDTFASFQILLCSASGVLMAAGHTIPFTWDGTVDDLPPDLNAIMDRAMTGSVARRPSTTLSALAAIVARPFQRQGLSSVILRAMRKVAADHAFTDLVAPVRPTWKSLYPLTPIERYAQWAEADGSPFDPWIRVHWRLGAEQLRIIPQAMSVRGTVAEWEEWTRMRFPETGAYVVPGALQPVAVDVGNNLARYEDPNIWMRHSTRG